MKARFNYDLSQVMSLLRQARIDHVVDDVDRLHKERIELIARADDLVRRMSAHAQQAVQTQASQLKDSTVRRLLRKI